MQQQMFNQPIRVDSRRHVIAGGTGWLLDITGVRKSYADRFLVTDTSENVVYLGRDLSSVQDIISVSKTGIPFAAKTIAGGYCHINQKIPETDTIGCLSSWGYSFDLDTNALASGTNGKYKAGNPYYRGKAVCSDGTYYRIYEYDGGGASYTYYIPISYYSSSGTLLWSNYFFSSCSILYYRFETDGTTLYLPLTYHTNAYPGTGDPATIGAILADGTSKLYNTAGVNSDVDGPFINPGIGLFSNYQWSIETGPVNNYYYDTSGGGEKKFSGTFSSTMRAAACVKVGSIAYYYFLYGGELYAPSIGKKLTITISGSNLDIIKAVCSPTAIYLLSISPSLRIVKLPLDLNVTGTFGSISISTSSILDVSWVANSPTTASGVTITASAVNDYSPGTNTNLSISYAKTDLG